MVNSLVLEEIVAGYSRNDKASIESVSAAAIDAEVATIRSTFESDGAFAERLAAAGLSPGTLRERTAARLAAQAWIDVRLAPAIAVSDEEIAAYFEEHRRELEIPATIRARHLFLSTVTGSDREAEIRSLAGELAAGADFAALAEAHSEDARSAPLGGDLGYFRQERMPADFIAAVWELPAGTRSAPVRTAIGWHIVDIIDRRPSRPGTLDELASEIRTTLENDKRASALTSLKSELKARAGEHLEYYYDTLLRAPEP